MWIFLFNGCIAGMTNYSGPSEFEYMIFALLSLLLVLILTWLYSKRSVEASFIEINYNVLGHLERDQQSDSPVSRPIEMYKPSLFNRVVAVILILVIVTSPCYLLVDF